MWNRMTIGTRLAAGFASLLALMLVMVLLALWTNDQVGQRTRILYQDRALPLQQLSELHSLLQRNRILVMGMLIDPGAANVKAGNQEFAANQARIQALLPLLAGHAESSVKGSGAGELQAAIEAYLQQVLLPTNRAMADNRYDDAQESYLTQVGQLAPPVDRAMQTLLGEKVSLAETEFNSATTTVQWARWVLPGVALLCLGLGTGLALAITRSIVAPLRAALHLSRSVASGDLTQPITAPGQDETAELLRALHTMQERLEAVVGEVRQHSATVHHSAREIADGNVDLHHRTELQASNLEKTATWIVELTKTLGSTAQSATRASDLAQQTQESIEHTGRVMQDMTATMQAIQQGSDRIADITGLIDSIAFQTNILALNAAVEAARAGEQGRGFAVVASEVRALAQRSADAAREIKQLIDASVEGARNGSRLVGEVDQRVTAAQAQVRELGQHIEGISSATQVQFDEVDELRKAVSELDAATQQNAALVEQSAAASESLSRQSQDLAQTVAFFRLH